MGRGRLKSARTGPEPVVLGGAQPKRKKGGSSPEQYGPLMKPFLARRGFNEKKRPYQFFFRTPTEYIMYCRLYISFLASSSFARRQLRLRVVGLLMGLWVSECLCVCVCVCVWIRNFASSGWLAAGWVESFVLGGVRNCWSSPDQKNKNKYETHTSTWNRMHRCMHHHHQFCFF